jgi:outer membrane receptor protein involved in Fe transport
MLKLFILLACITASQLTYSQEHQLTGTVTDSLTGKGLDKISVSLLASGKTKYSAVTDSTGFFSIEKITAGTYTLEFSGIGFKSKTIATAVNDNLNLKTIPLIAATNQLENVTVTSEKALVEDKGDRLVYNASGDISNTSGTAADVLRKVPTLTVDLNGSVQMRGNGNIKVLVNGKPSAMMARNLADALRQMPANVIKTVEVITSPGAKYDAEGAAGIINIITKKGLRGINGTLNATVGDRNRSLGTTLNARKGKIGLNLSVTGYQNRNTFNSSSLRTSLMNGMPATILSRDSEGDNTGTGGYGELAFDYDPDSLNHLNFSLNVWGGDYPNNSTTHILLRDASGSILQDFRNESRFSNPYGNGQMDLGWTRTFKKPGQEFSVLTQFSRMPDNYFYNTDRIAPDEKIIFREKSTNYSRNKEYTMQLDYVHPLEFRGKKDTSNMKIEIGSKAIIRDIGSEVQVEQAIDGGGELILDPSQANDFDYTQKVYSAYTSLRWSNKFKWIINTGSRLEHTEIKGDFITTATKVNSQYDNLIPNITISKSIEKSTFKISYTQRITRPQIWTLNPWVNRSDPKNISTGNPNLNPELNHMSEASHNLNTPKGFSLNTAVYWRLTDNAIEYVMRLDTASTTINQPLNIAKRRTWGFNIYNSVKPTKDWSLSGGFDLRHMKISSPALQQENSGWVWNANINTTYKLPKEYTLQAYSSINSGWISLQRSGNTIGYWYGFTAKKAFWKQKASLILGANNPFASSIRQGNSEKTPAFISTNYSYYVNRSFRLTFEWRFGQMTTDGGKQGKKISNDDAAR